MRGPHRWPGSCARRSLTRGCPATARSPTHNVQRARPRLAQTEHILIPAPGQAVCRRRRHSRSLSDAPPENRRLQCVVFCYLLRPGHAHLLLYSAYDDGRTQLLLCLHGLLPITFRNAAYHIPVAIWVTKDYPRGPPISYVIPTSDMLVRPGRFVQVSGLCTIDYITSWERKSEVCQEATLISLDLTTAAIGLQPTCLGRSSPSPIFSRTPGVLQTEAAGWTRTASHGLFPSF